MVRRSRGRITRLRKAKRCSHSQFHFEEGKGHLCDACGKPMSIGEMKFRQGKWMFYLGQNPAGRPVSASGMFGIGPPEE